MPLRWLTVALLALVSAWFGWAADTDILGTILDPQGRPVSAARIGLMTGSARVAETASDSDGHFRFPSVASGSHRLRAIAAGLA
jgi:hypothetical protein